MAPPTLWQKYHAIYWIWMAGQIDKREQEARDGSTDVVVCEDG